MAGGVCVADTSTIHLFQDGASLLRGNVLVTVDSHSPLEVGAAGLVHRPGAYRFGWMADTSDPTDSDFYGADLGLTPPQGFVEYGPRVTASWGAPFVIGAPWHIVATIGWEIQATYSGVGNNPFSGITFQLQASSAGVAPWYPVKTTASQSASGQTFRWACLAEWPLTANDTAVHDITFRMTAMAGTAGGGDTITCQLSEHRYVTVHYG